jgi:hypothetical protein
MDMTDGPETPEGQQEQPPDPSGEGGDAGGLVVVGRDEDVPQGADEAIEQPAKLVRIASMVQRMLNEVRDVEMDEASRRRLAKVYNRVVDELADILPGNLREELSAMVIHIVTSEEPPSQSELQLLHAQLVGWLEGLFHGIQASIASQQLALQEQLARMRKQQALESGRRPNRDVGQYL